MNGQGHITTADIVVADGFVLTELAGVVDTLRLANRVSALPVFEWKYRSAGGGPVSSSSEAVVRSEPFEDRPDAEYLFVIGNADPDCRSTRRHRPRYRDNDPDERTLRLRGPLCRPARRQDEIPAGTRPVTAFFQRKRAGKFETFRFHQEKNGTDR